MKCERSPVFNEIIVLQPDIYEDQRGHFLEMYQDESYRKNGILDQFVQDNLSCSTRGVIRGLHYQLGRPQGKLVWVVLGEIFDVAVDIRKDSPTFGQSVGLTLSAKDYRQIYIPEGFAHGFCVASETALVVYKCTDYYVPEEERGIRWDDPTLGIRWPVTVPILSDKDRSYPTLAEISFDDLPVFKAEI